MAALDFPTAGDLGLFLLTVTSSFFRCLRAAGYELESLPISLARNINSRGVVE
jgi:hypothetical protein